MDTYKLRDLGVTVGMFQDFDTFRQVIDYVFKTHSYHQALFIFGLDSVEDLCEALTDDKGMFSEDKAKDLCMDNLDGIDADDDDPESEWGDSMYDRAVGK